MLSRAQCLELCARQLASFVRDPARRDAICGRLMPTEQMTEAVCGPFLRPSLAAPAAILQTYVLTVGLTVDFVCGVAVFLIDAHVAAFKAILRPPVEVFVAAQRFAAGSTLVSNVLLLGIVLAALAYLLTVLVDMLKSAVCAFTLWRWHRRRRWVVATCPILLARLDPVSVATVLELCYPDVPAERIVGLTADRLARRELRTRAESAPP